MSEHSIIAPSSAGIWGPPDGCTAYPTMSLRFPQTGDNPEAMDGDASHEIGCKLITAGARGMFNTLSRGQIVDEVAANGVIFTDDMFDGAELYANDVLDIMRENGIFGGGNMLVENRVYMPRIHEKSNGTPDCAIFVKKKLHIYNWDYKFGYIVNEAFEHWQSINYIAGLCENWGLNGFDGVNDRDITVHIRIVQPRAYHKDGPIREWVVKLSELRGYFNQLHTNAHVALGPNATCRSGTHCRHCEARHACDAAIRGGWNLYEAASAPVPVEMSPRSLGFQYLLVKRARERLEYLETGYSEQIQALINSGTLVPGCEIEPTYGREKWTKPVAEVLRLGTMLKKDLKKPDEAITPNQARKKGINPEVIKEFSELPRKGYKTVPVDGTLAKKVFTHE